MSTLAGLSPDPTTHASRRTTHVWLLMFAAACGSPDLTIHARLHDRPLRGLEIIALPFDPGPLLDSLAEAAGEPRPAFPELEQELRAYRPPQVADLPPAPAEQLALHDSVVRLADSLRGRDRKDRGYRVAYDRLRTMYLRLGRLAGQRQRDIERFMADDRNLARRATLAADSIRAWEVRAHAGFEEAGDRRARESGREPVTLVTDSSGTAQGLPHGAWWLVAHGRDPENPFLEYRWQVGVFVGSLMRSLPMSEANARLSWRH